MEFEKVLYKRKAGSASARVTTCSAKAEHVQRDNAYVCEKCRTI